MGDEVNIHVEHLTRVEGHGDIFFNAKEGKVENVQWSVVEAPRFFEAMVRGKSYSSLQAITSRICGICSIGHSMSSLKASEAAMGVEISDQTKLLRRLGVHAENMQSHILHVGYLVSPDLFGVGSVFPLATTHKDAVLKIVGLHRLSNYMSDLICGRTIHPMRLTVGGFTMIPTKKELEDLKKRLIAAVEPTKDVAGIVLANADKLPDFKRETEYIALVTGKDYALYEGDIGSTDTEPVPPERYLEMTNEYLVPQSTAKYAKHNRESFMTGALARFNINYEFLSPLAKEVAGMFGLKPICYNPYMNSIAQIVEFVDAIVDSIAIIDELLDTDMKYIRPKFEVRAGTGVGAVEVPRGLLYHEYTINKMGNCVKANCVIPTNQNHGNIQHDFEAIAPTLVGKPEEEIRLTLEMLVRAYDPCISCSTHYLNVRFR